MRKQISKIVSMILCVAMLVGLVPVSALAANDYIINSTTSTDNYYNLISKKDWDNAPGISESEIVLNNDAGNYRQVIHMMKADVTNQYVNVIPTYAEMNTSKYQTQDMLSQAQYIDKNYEGTVLGTMNCCLSWYTGYPGERVGEPLGFMMMNGEIMFDPGNCGYEYGNVGFPTCVVINKDVNEDGEARPTDIPKVEMPQIKSAADLDGWEEQVIPISSGYIVKDGVNQSKPSHTGPAPRSVVGITADGQVVMMENDGRQSPYSEGMNMYECAEVMLDAGCVFAANCDGGGSSTFVSKRPGEDLKVNNSPSDGVLRPSTSGICFVSTAPATGEFVKAAISTEDTYYTPESEVQFNAVGADLIGNAADIPADAKWQITDGMGTIDENGLFVSNGQVGEVTAELLYNNKVVGSASINIVVPDEIKFQQSVITVSNGKSTELKIEAIYNEVHEVVTKVSDFELTLSNDNLGVIDGFEFTATEDLSISGGTITAALVHDKDKKATAELRLGKSLEVIFDFENGVGDWREKIYGQSDTRPYGYFSNNNVYSVDETNGKVHDGNKALALETDFTYSSSVTWNAAQLQYTGEEIKIENAQSIGCWVYVPDEIPYIDFMLYVYPDGSTKSKYKQVVYEYGDSITESGWRYVSFDISDYDYITISPNKTVIIVRVAGPKGVSAIASDAALNSKGTYYIDNITIDYSSAVADREAPEFTSPSVVNSLGVASEMSGQKVSNNQMNFEVVVADNAKDNATGIDPATAKAFVDGNVISCKYANGRITTSDVKLANGVHTIKFEIADRNGNVSSVSRQINVQGDMDTPTVNIVPHDTALDKILLGSLYYVDINATDVEKVDKVVTTLDLNNHSTWELDHMEVAEGFTASYMIDATDPMDKIATIIIERVENTDSTGEMTLVSLPIRAWEYKTEETPGGGTEGETWPPQRRWNEKFIWKTILGVDTLAGTLTLEDDSKVAFGSDRIEVNTELYANVCEGFPCEELFEGKDMWHMHTPAALEDKTATCTESGYTGRTFCEECESVVDWGTTEKAKGHDWMNVDGKLTCQNGGELFNGEYTDGKTYVDGEVVADGWYEVDGVKTSYFIDGVKLTGSHIIEDTMCTFDEKGTYLPGYKYDGWYEIDDTVMYFISNKALTGYQTIQGEFYLFDENGLGYDGEYDFCGTTVTFDDAQPVEDENILLAGMCGDDIQFVIHQDGHMIVDGTGAMYDYSNVSYNPWYADHRYDVKTLTIGKDITSIGDRAFYNLWYLEKVIFEGGSKLKNIKLVGLAMNNKMKEIELPYGVQTIGDASFRECNKLEKIVIPSSVTSIVSNSFYNTSNVTLYVVKDSYAESYAKKYGLKYVTYEEEERELAEGTCGENVKWSLTSKGVLTISGTGAMDDCETRTAPWQSYKNIIKKVIIGKDITKIGKFNFMQCSKLSEVVFEEESNLAIIGWGAFGYCASLKEVTIPATVKSLDAYAFYYCTALETVAFEENSELGSIGMYAFWQDTAMKDFFVPDKVVSIGENAFLGCKDTATFNVAEGTYSHDYFKNNNIELREPVPYEITSGSCGENVTWSLESTGTLTISGSGKMNDYETRTAPWQDYKSMVKKVVIEKDVTYIGKFSFMQCSKLSEVVFADGSNLETIGWGAFGYCSALKEVTIPATVESLDAYAFYYCTALETVAFEDNSELGSIGMYAFWQDTAMKDFFVPDKVVSIGENAFLGCKDTATFNVAKGTYSHDYFKNSNINLREPVPYEITNGTCGGNVTWSLESTGTLTISGSGKMNDYETRTAPWQDYKSMVKKVVIEKDVAYIGKFSFMQCKKITEVEFADGSSLETIGWGAFGYCSSLKEITIPATVKTLDGYAFYYCTALETVAFEENSELGSIGMYAFWNGSALMNINYPDNVKVGEGAFVGTAIK